MLTYRFNAHTRVTSDEETMTIIVEDLNEGTRWMIAYEGPKNSFHCYEYELLDIALRHHEYASTLHFRQVCTKIVVDAPISLIEVAKGYI
jgi:hypothetical protein